MKYLAGESCVVRTAIAKRVGQREHPLADRDLGPNSPPEYRGRLGDDPGLSRDAALRAATIGSAYALHVDSLTGSLSPGKLADLIVLDRNVLTVPPDDIAKARVLETVVGGAVVYTAD